MVQSILGTSSNSAISSINGTRKLDNSEIKAAFEGALSQTSVSSGKPSESSDSENLVQEFKNVTEGITVCKTCGAIYHGTAVVDCTKCGNNVNDDKKKTPEAQGTEQVASAEATEAVGGAESSMQISADLALVKAP